MGHIKRLEDIVGRWLRMDKSEFSGILHKAGGCYCRECKYGSKQGGYNSVGEADTCINCTRLVTQAHRGLIMPEDGFCSLGRPKEAKK